MRCNAKTMIKIGAALGAALALAYALMPDARALVLAGAPALLLLLCPISMIAMMAMMRPAAGDKPALEAVTAEGREAPSVAQATTRTSNAPAAGGLLREPQG